MAAPKMQFDSKYDDYDYPTTSPEVKSGHPGHTTKEQDAQVFQLRTQLEQAGYTERLDTLCMVRRFLCAEYKYMSANIPLVAQISAGEEIQCRACKADVSGSILGCTNMS